jgi:hypothetical protein
LWYQAGCRGRPNDDAIRITSSPSVKYTSGTVRSLPDLAPLAVSRAIGSRPIALVTRPPVARARGGSILLATLM